MLSISILSSFQEFYINGIIHYFFFLKQGHSLIQYNACDQCQGDTVSDMANYFGFHWMFPRNTCYCYYWALLCLSLETEARSKVATSTDEEAHRATFLTRDTLKWLDGIRFSSRCEMTLFPLCIQRDDATCSLQGLGSSWG